MKLSKTSAQAALAIAYLATQDNGNMIQARQVAKHLSIPTDSALKILQSLMQHGLIESRLGRSGGYRFNGSPQQTTLLQIVEAIDGPVTAEVPSVNSAADLGSRIGLLRTVCRHAAQQIRDELKKMTVEDLIQSDQLQVLSSGR